MPAKMDFPHIYYTCSGFGRSKFGFTLAELLIAVAILGVIAAFTIPKVLNAQQDTRRIAVFRETIGALETMLVQGVQEGSLTASNSYPAKDYILSRINAVKLCDGDSSTLGCWDQAVQGGINATTFQPGYVLSNGAAVVGIGNGGQKHLTIDSNGTEGPNIIGEDILLMVICYDNMANPCDSGLGRYLKSNQATVNKNLYLKIFAGSS